jgi:hypothetical protein
MFLPSVILGNMLHDPRSITTAKQKGVAMNTPHPTDQEEEKDPPNLQPDALPPLSIPSTKAPEPPSLQEYYIREDDQEEDGSLGPPSAWPFQISTDMPIFQQPFGSGQGTPAPGAAKKAQGGRPRFLRIASIAALVLVILGLGLLGITVFAQPAPPLSTTVDQTAPRPTVLLQQTPMTKPTPKPTPGAIGTLPGEDWVPQQLPAGWTTAGLTQGDAVFAERTAWTFTDREEGLDCRNVGTRAQHGGTFTASVFILSPGGKTRFFQNDIRVIDNTLFDRVQSVQLVQAAVNATPSLVQFQVQGQNQFALVDVSYQLYQSQRDSATGQRTEGLERDPTTNQPRTHHMSVLLVRVAPGTQGQNAPMGGSGWLVSSYGLDLTTPLPITQPI